MEGELNDMAKRYLTKAEKLNFKIWNSDYKNGTLLTENDLMKLCESKNYDPTEIGKYILDLNYKNKMRTSDPDRSEFDIDMSDVPCV